MAKDARLYATIALDLDENPKTAVLSDAAFRALVEMILWCRRNLTDGRITKAYAEHRWAQTVLDELCTNHPDRPTLIRYGGGDYGLHDYDEHQITTREITALRKQEISRARAAAGRKGGLSSGEARRSKTKQTRSKPLATPEAKPQPAPPRPQVEAETAEATKQNEAYRVRVRDTDTPTHLERASHLSNAHERASELAMSERNDLSPPVSIGATRLVAAIIGDKIGDAERTILRIKASEALHAGRTDDDLADCLRIWLTKPDLGPHALLCCLSEVDKRKLPTIGKASQKALHYRQLGQQLITELHGES